MHTAAILELHSGDHSTVHSTVRARPMASQLIPLPLLILLFIHPSGSGSRMDGTMCSRWNGL